MPLFQYKGIRPVLHSLRFCRALVIKRICEINRISKFHICFVGSSSWRDFIVIRYISTGRRTVKPVIIIIRTSSCISSAAQNLSDIILFYNITGIESSGCPCRHIILTFGTSRTWIINSTPRWVVSSSSIIYDPLLII